jgi:ABC-type transport system involved in multi-copper enzyme maturation permease subunit
VNGFATILLASLREHARRRTAYVALALGALFVGLYTLGIHFIWAEVTRDIESGRRGPGGVLEVRLLVPATMFGLSMFATWFLAAVAATFMAAGGIRGEAERGVLQHVLVRPVARHTVLVARLAAAALLAIGFLVVVVGCCALATRLITGWTPGNLVKALLLLALGTTGVTAIATAFSVRLHGVAAGIASLMLFGVGLVGGLLEQLGNGIAVSSVQQSGEWISTAMPFEAMYQAALHQITADVTGLSGIVVRLGPFGGARAASAGLVLWALAWTAVVVALAAWRLRRRDF